MGDLVIRRDEPGKMIFEVTEFDGQKVILQGYSLPIITISEEKNLIKLNNKRSNGNCIKRIK